VLPVIVSISIVVLIIHQLDSLRKLHTGNRGVVVKDKVTRGVAVDEMIFIGSGEI
jgi:hypothetical protein